MSLLSANFAFFCEFKKHKRFFYTLQMNFICFFSRRGLMLVCLQNIAYLYVVNIKTITIMASRRNLKKVITYIADQLATQAFFASYASESGAEAWVDVFNRIFALNKEYIARANHPEPGLPARKYFDTLCISFNEDAKAILDDIQKLQGE